MEQLACIKKFDDPAKTFALWSEEAHELDNLILVTDPNNLQDIPLNVTIWSPFTIDFLWASSWLSKDHEDLKRMTMNNVSRT